MTPKLITIPISHYCEKARWALDYSRIPYQESQHLQLFHMFHTYRAAKSDTVPVLVTDEGVFKDSTDIMKWADSKNPAGRKLYPEDIRSQVEALEDDLDEGYAVTGRGWMYSYMLHPSRLPTIQEMTKKHDVPRIEQMLLPVFFPIARRMLAKVVGLRPDTSATSQAEVTRHLDRIAERLKDGRPYLFGDRFTAADLAFAALSAPVIQPENYGVQLPRFELLPEEMRRQVEAWRQHPAGKYAQSLFSKMRKLTA